MLSKSARYFKSFAPTLAILGIGMMLSGPASAADFFDRLQAITGKLGTVKVFAIYIAFLIGIIALIWMSTDMLKLSKPDQRNEATWTGVLIKGVAGGLLVALTFTSDTMQQTLFGTSNGSSVNTSMMILNLPVFG